MGRTSKRQSAGKGSDTPASAAKKDVYKRQQGEQVEVAFDIDKTAAGGNRYGFAPATGNLMYCMPQKGTDVYKRQVKGVEFCKGVKLPSWL